MATLHGKIFDATSSAPVAAKVHILDSTGHFRAPKDHVLKVGPGRPFFYCEHDFDVTLPRGSADILVERGTEYEPFLKTGKDSEGDLDNVAYSRSALDCRQLHCQAHQSEGQSKEA